MANTTDMSQTDFTVTVDKYDDHGNLIPIEFETGTQISLFLRNRNYLHLSMIDVETIFMEPASDSDDAIKPRRALQASDCDLDLSVYYNHGTDLYFYGGKRFYYTFD